jgi:hypothetical protein
LSTGSAQGRFDILMADLRPDQPLQARAQFDKYASLAQGMTGARALTLLGWHGCQSFFQQGPGPLGGLLGLLGGGFF